MSHSIDETYSVYSERVPVAAKPYKCEACREPIAPGHKYARAFIVFEGKTETVIRCLRCQKIHEHLRDKDGWGETWPDERLDCGRSYEFEWGEPPPESIAALAFVLPQEVQP